MFYTPVIFAKQYEKALSHFFHTELKDPRLKPLYLLTSEEDASCPGAFTKTVGNPTNEPFICVPRDLSPDKHKHWLCDVNKSANDYLGAATGLLNFPEFIPTFQFTNHEDIQLNSFVQMCHAAGRRCAVYTSTPFDYAILNEGDFVLYNMRQDVYGAKRTVKDIRNNTQASICLIGENRSLQLYNTALVDSEIIDATQQKIHGSYVPDLLGSGIKVNGFGDFAGFKDTTSTAGGNSKVPKIKTIVLYDKAASQFHVIKDEGALSIKDKIINFESTKLPVDHKVNDIFAQYIKGPGAAGQYNALSIYYYLVEMLLNDDWSLADPA